MASVPHTVQSSDLRQILAGQTQPDGAQVSSDLEFDSLKVLTSLRRLFNILREGEMVARKEAIDEIKVLFDEYKTEMVNGEMLEILLEFSKMLLNCFSDQSEKIRENSIKIYSELISRCGDDITPHVKYIIDVLIFRLNCHDLEGVEGVDPKMLPTPSQKPHKMVKIVEESEQVREQLLNLTSVLMEVCNADHIRPYMDEIISIISALLMDPSPDIQVGACKLMSQFVVNFKELVYHFTVKLARALLLPLTSRKSFIKIAAIQALHDLMFCGTWKYTSDVFDILVGFKDPNYVAIKEFYESCHNINYLALLINSPNPSVREAFIQMIGDLLTTLPDRYDIETRLVPYFLTGLFDELDDIQNYALTIIDEVGLSMEREKEKEFREVKQLGFHPEWSYEGKLLGLPLPKPFKARPRLGARYMVKAHLYKLIIPIGRELKDRINIQARLRAAQLLEMMLVFCEEGVVDNLNALIPVLNNIFLEGDEQKACKEKVQSILRLIGRFSPSKAFLPICFSIVDLKITDNEESSVNGLNTLQYILEGYFEALPPGEGLLDKKKAIIEVLEKVTAPEYLEILTKYMLPKYADLLSFLFNTLQQTATPAEQQEIYAQFKKNLTQSALVTLSMPIFSLVNDTSVDLNYKLIKNCIENTSQLEQDKQAGPILSMLAVLSKDDPLDLFDLVNISNPASVARSSAAALAMVSLSNYYLLKKLSDPFRDTLAVIELMAVGKETFNKTIINLNSYFTFFVEFLLSRCMRSCHTTDNRSSWTP